jgi:polyhydroxyalkanoate synthesis regulator phasin
MLVTKMVNLFLKREDKDELETFVKSGDSLTNQDSSVDEDVFDSLQRLEDEAARLVEQKVNLAILLNQLENKAKTKVEKRKQEVERLNSEVLDLKQRCEKITLLVNSKSTLECSQAGF